MRALLLLFGLAACDPVHLASKHAHRSAEKDGFQERRIEAGGASIHAWVGGHGPPVLLIHGFGGSGLWTWKSQMEALVDQHTVVVPDLLWFGDSTSAAQPTLEAETSAMLGLLDALNLEKADIAGISYGGFVTLTLAQDHPERVGRMIIVDSPGPYFTEQDQADMLAHFGAARLEDIFVPQGPDDVERLMRLAYAHPPWIPHSVLGSLYRDMFAPYAVPQRALLADLVARRGQDQALPACPRALVIWGQQDAVFPVARGQELASALGAELVSIPDTAHAPNVERPEAVNSAILGFLSSASPEEPAGSRPCPSPEVR